MPKEQVRKRGKRKTKQADEGESRHAAPIEVKIDVRPFRPDTAPHQQQQYSAPSQPVAGPSAIHPARAALLSGQRYVPPPAAASTSASASTSADFIPLGDGQPAADPENGEAQWNRGPRADQEFPFGIVDPDLKAYFRGVEEQIKDWEGTSSVGEEREDRKQFLTSILGELRTHELQLATDPECSVVIERLLASMGDRGRRILGDSLAGNWETLIRHRFGSHVVQSWIRLGADALDREEALPNMDGYIKSEEDQVLPSTEALFSGLIESLRPTLATLLTHPHASPPVRLLFLVLSPDRALPDLSGGDSGGTAVRSKRSGKYRKNHAVEGKTFLADGDDDIVGVKGKEKAGGVKRKVPKELTELGREVRVELAGKINEGEWRLVGVDVVGSPAVQTLLELEAGDGEAEKAASLLDNLTEGLVSEILNDQTLVAKLYIPSLFTTQPGTHLLETILITSSARIFAAIWQTYFVGKIGRLAGHPTANYVVARAIGRLELEVLQGVVRECKAVAGGKGMIKTGRISVLQALVERGAKITDAQPLILDLLRSALDLPEQETAAMVPCIMALKTFPTFMALSSGEAEPEDKDELPEDAVDKAAEEAAAAAAKYAAWQNRRSARTEASQLEPNIKGSLLLQGLLGLAEINAAILDSLFAQDSNTLMGYATSPISSRFLDAVLTQSAVPSKYKRMLMNGFMGRYKFLVEDRMGSRVGDTIWDHADGFMKEKIARSLTPHATALSNSTYGRFFAKKLNLQLLVRRPDEWKEEVIGVKHHFAHQKKEDAAKGKGSRLAAAAGEYMAKKGDEAGPGGEDAKPKRKAEEEDEIDTLFAGVEKKKKSKKSRE